MNQPTEIKCFFAYPSSPKSHNETIETAINRINQSGNAVAQSWKELAVTGRVVIQRICSAIDEADIFAADLTYLNPNVLFELGYAVSKNKRIWIMMDSSYPEALKNYREFKLLSPVGYSEYRNAYELADRFYKEGLQPEPESTLFRDIRKMSRQARPSRPFVLYLKCPVNTEASVQLSSELERSHMSVVVDDPEEISVQALGWYTEKSFYSAGVVAHLIDDERSEQHQVQSAKYSFISGLALGLGKPLLILAHSPFVPPFDYQDLLHVHDSASRCVDYVRKWLPVIEESIENEATRTKKVQQDASAEIALQAIDLGDYIAENERDDLIENFIETVPYLDALRDSGSKLFVGRKGSGKTASLFKLADEFQSDKRNQVSIIRPVDYEIEGIVELLDLSLPRARQGFLVETLWKFLLYTQLAADIYTERISKTNLPYSEDEEQYISFFEDNREFLEPDFTTRLENAVTVLGQLDLNGSAGDQRAKISEALHKSLLRDLRIWLGRLLGAKKKVVIFVDNLDKAWRLSDALPPLARFLFGLLRVGPAIEEEFQREGISWQAVDLSIYIFLRSDIFAYINKQVSEADKLPVRVFSWNDSELLQRVIEERFVNSTERTISRSDVWETYFERLVNGKKVEQHILESVIPKPRDIIYYCRSSLNFAKNRRHQRIEEEDIVSGQEEYSYYAFQTLIAETKPYCSNIEDLLLEWAGANEIISHRELEQSILNVGISSDSVDEVIDLLADSLFLGLEVAEDQFRYLYDENSRDVTRKLARTTANKTGLVRYKINPPYHAFLEVRG